MEVGIQVNDQLIHEIKTKINLTDVVGEYTRVEADGNNFKCCCPLPGHQEKTPSFTIFGPSEKAEWQTMYCFGCHAGNREETGIGNDVISFVMAMENMSFIEACQYLCDKYGIPYQNAEVNPEILAQKKKKTDENLKYHANLMSNQLVQKYLMDRGVRTESFRKFRLGLTYVNEYQGWKRNRLVFGITDTHYDVTKASTVAFGFRSLQGQIETPDGMEYFPNDMPDVKYRNDPESNIFDKGKTLYGLNYAIPAIRKKKFAIVVEGYMDVILMHQAGFENTVAPLGTSFTDAQMDLVRKYTDQLLFFLDSDNAGLKSMQRVLPRLLEKGFSVLVVEAPHGYDPADLVNSLGQDSVAVQNYIKNNSTPALQWYVEKSLKVYDAIVHKAKVEALNSILPIIDKVAHRESQIAYISNISNRIGVDASAMLMTRPQPHEEPKEEKATVFKQAVPTSAVVSAKAQQQLKMWSPPNRQ